MSDRASQICKRLGELRAERSKYEAHWAECYKYGAPERQQCFSGGSGSEGTREKQRADLLDSTAAESILIFVSNLIAGTTPANAIWFKAVPDGMDDQAELTPGEHWLEQVAQFLFYQDIDREKGGGFTYQCWPIGECFIASTRPDGQVDTIYREYTKTAAQLVTEFGENKVSDAVRNAYQSRPDDRFKIVHVIEPRKVKASMTNRVLLPKNMPFASYHVEVDGKNILKESGYNEFPCAVPRFRKIPGSVYGIGVMSTALPDAKSANALMRDTLRSAEIDVLGFWIAEDDGILNPRTVRIGGGKIVPAGNVDSMKRLDSGRGFQVADPLLDRLQSSIRRKLMADGMAQHYNTPPTAAEIYARPILDRAFGLAYRAEALGEAPEDLQGRNLSFKFISPLARAQKLEEVASIERLMASLGSIIEVAPDALDNINLDAVPQVLAAGLGAPTSIMRTTDELQAYREQKAQAQQQAAAQEQEAAMAQQMTGAVAQGMGKGLEAQMVSEVMQ